MMTIFRMTWVLVGSLTFSLSASAAEPARTQKTEKTAVAQLRGVTTNHQFHRDGTVRLAQFRNPDVTDEILLVPLVLSLSIISQLVIL